MSEKNGSSGKPDVTVLRAEIKQTRAELGETVQALAAKADVKARAKEQVEQTKQKVRAQAVEAGEKVRDVAYLAGDRVKHAAVSARGNAAEAGERAHEAGERIRRNPVPMVALLAGVAALVGMILVVRGRRR